MLWSFEVHSGETQPYVSTCPFSPKLLFAVFLRMCLPTGVRWYLIEVSIFSYPIINDVECFFKWSKKQKQSVLHWPLDIGFWKVCCVLNCFFDYRWQDTAWVMCPLQPCRLCEYEVTISSRFQVVVTENAHEEAALCHAPGGFLGQQEP